MKRMTHVLITVDEARITNAHRCTAICRYAFAIRYNLSSAYVSRDSISNLLIAGSSGRGVSTTPTYFVHVHTFIYICIYIHIQNGISLSMIHWY